MKRPTDRRTVLKTVGAAAVAAVAGPVAAQSTDIRGVVRFEGGTVIPKGHLEIYLEDPAIQNGARRRAAQTRIRSDGNSKTVAFSLSPPASSTASPTLRIVARLERADGWLVARGSIQFKAGSPVNVTLNTVMY
ncbi:MULTISPECIES: twin-arginine translocation signal domain-containing protein [unclassified Sinorhizobium]|uniref:twin-arginine translocation signal domain-containing protein n=1 Tax=unclassified Sinorhizobium TaxID=2613772 RepID=UPI0024C3DA9C|nr:MULTISPECIES: twin-arginine translocation signal domain-containing protein [unclassified Sinorhizobium]MDK1374174.1 twin-arginine translocation signal domain-containing protein [Sinorhizobium sp. 6-70]MDK1480396.1 twin-arginine translocation signal domain-containing protein [Sinorhizobium sp. 6-117]